MKNIRIIYSIIFLAVIATGCMKNQGMDQDLSFLNSAKSSNPSKVFDISNDNSGNVTITPTGEGVSSFIVHFGQGTGTAAQATVAPGGKVTHSYPEGTYTVAIDAYTIAGTISTTTYPLTVTYVAPPNLVATITKAAHKVTVSATALYAKSFLVYFGDVTNETGTALAIGGQVSHTYVNAGNYDVKVVALSGGAATSQKISTITVTDPFGLPITFESAFINYFFGTFGGGQAFAKVANPSATGLNTSATVGKFTRGYESWSGTYSPLDNPIDFSQGNKIKVLVYNPDPAMIGAKLNVELESGVAGSGAPANGVGVLKVPVTTSGAWEELVFDFSTITAIPSTAKFGQLVLRFNDSVNGAGAIIYVDNFRLTN